MDGFDTAFLCVVWLEFNLEILDTEKGADKRICLMVFRIRSVLDAWLFVLSFVRVSFDPVSAESAASWKWSFFERWFEGYNFGLGKY